MSERNIVLIGGRAAGKSTLSDKLSLALSWPVFSTDEAIVEALGMPIDAFVDREGWGAFREMEQRVVHQCVNLRETIIDTGGGVVTKLDEHGVEHYHAGNVASLKRHGILYWLDVPLPLQQRWLADSHQRPALDGQSAHQELEAVMKRRRPWYAKAADHQLQVGEDFDTLTELILEQHQTS